MRHALRHLLKSRSYAGAAMLVVAIGVGAVTSIFSAVNAVVLRPPSLPDPERLVAVYETNPGRNIAYFSCAYRNYVDWRARTHSWANLAAIGERTMNLTGTGEPEVINVRPMSASLLPTLGLTPVLGRNFLASEDLPGRGRVAIISTALWRERFGGRDTVIGQTLTLDGLPYEIIGVVDPGAAFPGEFEIGVPMAIDPATARRMEHDVAVFGRLRPGVSVLQADAELKAVAAAIWRENPESDQGWSVRLVPYATNLVGASARQALFLLLGAVGVLLLIACANLSNLIVAQTSVRSHEIAVRIALGATRGRVVRHLIGEALLLTIAGGLGGLLLSWWIVGALHHIPFPRAGEISLDYRVLAVAALATVLTGLLASAGPAFAASRTDPRGALKGRTPELAGQLRGRDALVVTQIALALMLFIGATLLARSFWRMVRANPGFDVQRVMTCVLRPTVNTQTFYDALESQVSSLPEVVATGLVSSAPLSGQNTSLNIFPDAPNLLGQGMSAQADWRLADGGYFAALGIPVISGRTFAGLRSDVARDAVVISASLARTLWGNTDVIGRRVDPGGHGRWLTVIGVVGDVHSANIATATVPTFYYSRYRFEYGPMTLVTRTRGAEAPLLAAIRESVKRIDPTVPLYHVRTMEDLRDKSLMQPRMLMVLLGAFAATALLLATIGTYAVIGFMVQKRTGEMGIRMALGADAMDIFRLILGRGAKLALIGVTMGSAGALLATRALGAFLFQTPRTDVASFALGIATIVLAALAAAFIPARHAARVDPCVALRTE
ncbi:MAG TPA: ABC transporter permease [Opitutaceae bacterium]|nr:ABC transporter permease [Opitutaceae bacterium]